ncbi:MAG: DUF6675 family protein [Treponemataceae bacterium]
MNLLKKTLGLFSCLFCFCSLFSQEFPKIEDVLASDLCRELSRENRISNFFLLNDETSFELSPCTETVKEYQAKWEKTRDYKPNFTLESLYRIDGKNYKNKIEELEKIETIMRSISKLEGIQYFSQRRNKICTLYHKAYRVDSSENRNKLEDDYNINKNPIYCFFEDNSFGEYVCKLNYGKSKNEIFLQYENQDTLGFQLIKAIKKENMLVFLDTIRCQDELLVYVFIQARADVGDIFKNKIYRSFVARSDALYSWLKASYDGGEK